LSCPPRSITALAKWSRRSAIGMACKVRAAGGDDSAGAVLTSADSPEGVVIWNVNDGSAGSIAPIDIATTGIPRPGGNQSNASTPASTSPAINFAKAVADAQNVVCVIVPMAVGARGVWTGGDQSGSGPWDPDGTGPAWDPEDGGTATDVSGALYKALADDSGNGKSLIQNGFETALAASDYAEYAVLDPIFFGYPMNENDRPADHHVLISRGMTAMSDIRNRWGAPSAPWVMTSPPPEWSATNILRDAKISACLWEIANRLPYVAYVEGPSGMQHPTEQIHYNNVGYRAMGTAAFDGLAIAETSAAAPNRLVDWADDLSEEPDRVYSLHRALSHYSGHVIEVDNGTSTTNIGVDSDGYLDYAALLAHARLNANEAWVTKIYDATGSGSTMVPEGTGNAYIVTDNSGDPQICIQGNRPAWGLKDPNVLLKDTSVTVQSGSAYLFCGLCADAGNRVLMGGQANTLGLLSRGGVITISGGGNAAPIGYTPDVFEPSWAVNLRGILSLYAAGPDLYEAGKDTGPTTTSGTTYTSAGLAIGGRIGAVNRNYAGATFTAAWWAAAPSGGGRADAIAATEVLNMAYDVETDGT